MPTSPTFSLRLGDSREVLRRLPDASVDSVVCDPPYVLDSIRKRFGAPDAAAAQPGTDGAFGRISRGFMGAGWDVGDVVHSSVFWAEVYRVLKPGGYLVAFSGTRTQHWMVCAIALAGFDIRDQLAWMFGSGMPKGQAWTREKAEGAKTPETRAESAAMCDAGWEGWARAGLKPAWEPICLARKPLGEDTVAANVLRHGTGALNIDGCRIDVAYARNCSGDRGHGGTRGREDEGATNFHTGGGRAADGRWPANVAHDGSRPVLEAFAAFGERGAASPVRGTEPANVLGKFARVPGAFHGDTGSPARFFFEAKASRTDRNEGCEKLPKRALNWSSGDQSPGTFQSEGTEKEARNHHPTVKPTDLMAWLARLVTRPGGLVLDPFMGSGSTGKACALEGFSFIGVELDPDFLAIAACRVAFGRLGAARLAAEVAARPVDLFAPPPAPILPVAPMALIEAQADLFGALE